MSSSVPDTSLRHPRPALPKVIIATTAMLSFISFWRAAAIVLNDLGSSAYYAGGEAEGFIGKSAPWFVLAVMLFSGAITVIYIESCSMFVRGGVYRTVKEALGGTLAKVSVSALMFDYVLTGPISGVAAGRYLGGLINDLFSYVHIAVTVPAGFTAAVFAVVVTGYFWWENIKGIPESSHKALRIMQVATVMVVILIAWCVYTAVLRHSSLPPFPRPSNIKLDENSLGWLYSGWGSRILQAVPLIAIFVGIGHSVLAMTGAESLAQVYREIEHPKLPNLKKAGLVIFLFSMLFTSLVSFFAVMIIPDNIRPEYLENLIGGLAMNLEGPLLIRLLFHVFVVAVGTAILAGAANTAIVGSNGVLNRVSEDGVLPDWFRQPHRKFGTSYRIINMIVALQITTIVLSRGDVTYLADLYAFGVIWSFALNGIAVLVLRYKRPEAREFRVPLNIQIGKTDFPVGVALITLILLAIAIVNLVTKPRATVSGLVFSVLLFTLFVASEKISRKGRSASHVEMDQFNVAAQAELNLESVGCRPGNVIVPVSNYHALYHLSAVLDRVKPERRDVVVLHARILRRTPSGETEIEAGRMFGSIEQYLFTQALSIAEKHGKPIRLAVIAASDIWEGILRAAVNLQSSTIVLGHSSKYSVAEQARQIGMAWEALPLPRPQFNIEIFEEGGKREFFLLGPHAPNLTANEIQLVHQLWLKFSDLVPAEELHHHDIVHFALDEVVEELKAGKESEIADRLREHLRANQVRRTAAAGVSRSEHSDPPPPPPPPPKSGAESD
jgi:amino acid transporter